MANAKLRYRKKVKALRELSNGYPLQSLSTGGLDNGLYPTRDNLTDIPFNG